MVLPTGTDGCRKYEENDFPKSSEYKLAILLEESNNCNLSKRIGNEQDLGISFVFIKHSDNQVSNLLFNNESIRGIK